MRESCEFKSMSTAQSVQTMAKASNSASVRASTRERGFVIQEPQEPVREVVMGVPLKEEKDASKRFTEWQLVRHDNARMRPADLGPFVGQSHEIFYVERQNGATLSCGKAELSGIRGGSVAGFFGRRTITPPVSENRCQERIDVFIEIELYRRDLMVSSRLAARSCSISARLS